MIKKLSKFLLVFSALIITINTCYSYYNTSSNLENIIKTKSYNFKIKLNGGNINDNKVIISENSTKLPTINKKGYNFLGFSETEDGNVVFSTKIDNINNINNKILYPKWSLALYDINYDLNGGTASNLKNNYSIEEEFKLPIPNKNGYDFQGWTGTDTATPILDLTIAKGTTGNLSYKANWEPKTYSINYNLNGGSTSSSNKSSYSIETPTFNLINPTKKGYDFQGWTGANGNTPNKNVSISLGSTGNKSYTANWKATNYTITYNLNGGTASNLKNSYNIESKTFTLPTPYRTGYNFQGWTGANGNTPSKNVSISLGSIGNKSYTANWKKYDATKDGGVTLISKRNSVTWGGTLDGHYNSGDNQVHSGNWIVTVNGNNVKIQGTNKVDRDYTYEFWVYKGNNTDSKNLLGYTSVKPAAWTKASATITW